MSSNLRRHVPPREALTAHDSPFLFWFAGAGSGKEMGTQLQLHLETDDAFGPGNMRFIPSIISWETPSQTKYTEIALQMIKLGKEGRRIVAAGHSLGLMEMVATFRKVKDLDLDFFENDFAERLDTVSISGVGLNTGLSQGYLVEGLVGLKDSHPMGFSSTVGRGIGSLAVVHHSELEDEVLAEHLRRYFHPEVSHHDERFTIAHVPLEEADLNDRVHKKVRTIDEHIMHDFDHRERDELVKDLQERGRVTRREVIERYTGKNGLRLMMLPAEVAFKVGLSLVGLQAIGYFEIVRLLPDFINDDPAEMLRDLEQKGAKIWFIHPEYDSFYTAEDIIRQNSQFERGVILEAELDNHTSLVANPARVKGHMQGIIYDASGAIAA